MATPILSQASSANAAPKKTSRRGNRAGRPPLADGGLLLSEEHDVWGHLGIRVPGASALSWYPVTAEHAYRLRQQLRRGASWVVVTTLNNRALMLNASAVKVVMQDADADEPDGWVPSWDNAEGYPQAVYRGLYQYRLSGERMPGALEAFKAMLRGIIEEHALDEDALYSRLRVSRVHYRDGTSEEIPTDAGACWAAFSTAALGADSPALDLSCQARGLDVFVARDSVAVVDMPLHLMLDAATDQQNEIDAEGEAFLTTSARLRKAA